nr:unnamed protein product [Digitaria exilis]
MSLAASIRKPAAWRGAGAARGAGRRRGAVVLLLALAYAAGTLVFLLGGRLSGGGAAVEVASSSLHPRRHAAGGHPPSPPQPGSVYRSHLVFERLWPAMRDDATAAASASSLSASSSWRRSMLMTSQYQNSGEPWMPCVNSRLTQSELPPSNGYLMIEANGGLNQQRLSICDAVAVASLLNATIVIPTFHVNSVWRDSSKFGDIFDEDHFMETLREHVRVLKKLPEDVLLRFNHNISSIPNMRTKAYSSAKYYVQKVLPKMLELGVVRIAPFSNRLAQSVPSNMQALRCLLPSQFIKHQVGMMLRGMGFDNTTSLYVASGKIYNSEKYMAPLRQMFPLLATKDSLALPEELAQFKMGSV